MNDPDHLRLLAEIRDLLHRIADRQKAMLAALIVLIALGLILCTAFITEIAVVVRFLFGAHAS